MPALDGLRGVAILMVILTHTWTGRVAALSIYEDTGSLRRSFVLPEWMDRIGSAAVHGVTLFFVISAFTLTVRFASDPGADLRQYALRRIARIGPAYWLAGLCYAVVAGLGPRSGAPNGLEAHHLAIAAVFARAWWDGPAGAVVPGGWSISCEVAFYAALPVIVWATRFRLWPALLLTAILALTAQMLARHDAVSYAHPAIQAPVFMCGVTAAIAAIRLKIPECRGLAIMIFALAIVGVPFSPMSGWFVERHFQFAGLAAIGVALVAQHPIRILTSRLLRRVGEVSYSMYLLHFGMLAPSLYVCQWLVPGNSWPTFVCHFVLTSGVAFACAGVTYRFIEQPSVRWAATYLRTRPSHSPAPAT